MPMGPGIYDELATELREQTHALGVAVVVIAGSKGSGFSVQGPMAVQASLPDILESMARQLREALGEGGDDVPLERAG